MQSNPTRDFKISLSDLWSFKITTVSNEPITVGKIVLGLSLFVIAVFIARIASRLITRKVFRRLKVDIGVQQTIETVLFYILIIFGAVFALQISDVPLTFFHVIGGAVALGVGFGSRNVLNNFISGLILLVERPVKVGDLVEIENVQGVVESVGARSTKVRTYENQHLIMPNSFFLEKAVVNWTLSDNLINSSVSLGVAYGTDTEKLKAVLIECVLANDKVIADRKPEILFTNFGDNALEFKIHFWYRVETVMDQLQIESELRYQLDKALRDNDIVISFPQRDVHLDSKTPLQVKVISDV